MSADPPPPDVELAAQIARRLGDRTVCTAESCTAGRICAAFAAVEGAAHWFRGGLVAYQTDILRSLLDVTAPSVYNERAAEEMVLGGVHLLNAHIGVAATGVAGPDSQDGVPPGTIFIATSVDAHVTARTHHFDGDADAVCDRARRQALLDLTQDLLAADGEHA